MVLDAAFYASTVTSLMMNGVCCVWQMQQEEEQRASFRQDIRAEYERQRDEEFKVWEQRQSFYAESDASTFSSSLSPHSEPYMLREKVVREKMNMSARIHRRDSDSAWETTTRRSLSPRRLPLRMPVVPPASTSSRFAQHHAFPAPASSSKQVPDAQEPQREQPPQLIEDRSINNKKVYHSQGFVVQQGPRNLSCYPQVHQDPPSLMDLVDDERDDEVPETQSMVSVAIQ